MKRGLCQLVASMMILTVSVITLHAQLENPPQPISMLYHQLVYHEKSNSVFMFGGQSAHGGSEVLVDAVWQFTPENKQWTRVSNYRATLYVDPLGNRSRVPAQSPVLDTESNRIIVFNLAKKTWAFNPESMTWEKMSPESYPPGRCGQSMAYDAESDRVLLFGGYGCKSLQDDLFNDIWAYDYNTDSWEEIKTDTVPPERIFTDMVYHAASDRIHMWGGRLVSGTFEDTTMWLFDYNQASWNPIPAKGGPELPYAYTELIYHPVNQEIFMYGGGPLYSTFSGYNRDETWIYSSEDSSWMMINPVNIPGVISNHSMAYMAASDQIILYGGEIGEQMYEDNLLEGTWFLDYSTKGWREELFVFAGEDGLWCPDQLEEVLLGGAPTAWGGVEPYSYTWDAEGYVNGSSQDIQELLDDASLANPKMISLSDSVAFYLEVSDSVGTVTKDTLWYAFSNLSVCPDLWTADFFRGDSIQLDHCVQGGMGLVSYQWSPAEYLSDSSASRPWAKPDSQSITFELIAQDTFGCEVRSEYALNYSTVGIQDPADPGKKMLLYAVSENGGTMMVIEHALPESLSMEIFRVDGSVAERVRVEQGRSQKNLDHLSPGIYLYRIRSSHEVLANGKIIVH